MLLKKCVAQDKGLDNTFDLLKEGYLFIGNRSKMYDVDMFETHLLGQKVICMTGEEAARIFYNQELFQRKGAAPNRVQETLLGENAIQTMDGETHSYRKQLFISLTNTLNERRLSELTMKNWEESVYKWEDAEKVILFDEAKEILCKAACQWAGVPLSQSEVKDRAEDFSAMIDSFAAIGPRHWKGRTARNRIEAWIKDIIDEVRSSKLKVEEDSALYTMAFHREQDGCLMESKMAAVELINLIRPIVAISTFITFSALALYEHPECKNKLFLSDNSYYEMFVQEVRRYYPFAPFIGARVRNDFSWHDYQFKQGMLVILDLYGTNQDTRVWDNPDKFYPERFKERKNSLFDFIPQGGGNSSTGHRCPGEGITVGIMKTSLDFLVNRIEYEVPKQDLSYSLTRIPTFPESGFIMNNIRLKAESQN